MSQGEMAAHFGISNTSYGRWENGSEPSFEDLVKLADIFKVTVDDLLRKEFTPETVPPRWGQVKEYPKQPDETLLEVQEPGEVEILVLKVTQELALLRGEVGDLKKDIETIKATGKP